MDIARQGVAVWNAWRASNLRVQPDLTRIDLAGADLRQIDFRGVGLFKANLLGADLREANLRQSILIKTSFAEANLSGAHVYGASVWSVELTNAVQENLIVTPPGEAIVAVDNLEVAQFIYLLLSNSRIRDVIDSLTSKTILILGRFTPERKAILERIRQLVRREGLLPILFDFDVPKNRDATETVSLLAHMARAVIADITDQASVPHELMAITPNVQVPIVPIVLAGYRPYSMLGDFQKYPWVRPLQEYSGIEHLEEQLLVQLRSL